MSNHEIERLHEYLRGIEYLWVGKPIRTWFLGKIIGWNIKGSSLLRKNYSIARLQEEIDDNNLPLAIIDEPEYTNSFVVFIKK